MAQASRSPSSRRDSRIVRRQKLIGLAALTLPAAVFISFAIGEGIGGEAGWWGHAVQIAVLVVLVVVAWLRPRVGGALLVLAGVALVGFIAAARDLDLAGLGFLLALVVVPMIAAGVLFIQAGRGHGGVSTRSQDVV